MICFELGRRRRGRVRRARSGSLEMRSCSRPCSCPWSGCGGAARGARGGRRGRRARAPGFAGYAAPWGARGFLPTLSPRLRACAAAQPLVSQPQPASRVPCGELPPPPSPPPPRWRAPSRESFVPPPRAASGSCGFPPRASPGAEPRRRRVPPGVARAPYACPPRVSPRA